MCIQCQRTHTVRISIFHGGIRNAEFSRWGSHANVAQVWNRKARKNHQTFKVITTPGRGGIRAEDEMSKKIVQVYHVIRPESRLFKPIIETYRTETEAQRECDYFNYIMTDGIKATIKAEDHEVGA